jgi:hypothetical protein
LILLSNSFPPSLPFLVAPYRRSYIGKGHDGQPRSFKVKFLGEGVNDYGGPYRAVFEQIIDELKMDNIVLNNISNNANNVAASGNPLPTSPTTPASSRVNGTISATDSNLGGNGTGSIIQRCVLPLLFPSPNRLTGTGMNQDKYLLSSSGNNSVLSPINQELMIFLGRFIGMAIRHHLNMALDLTDFVWIPLVRASLSLKHLEFIDNLTYSNIQEIKEMGEKLEKERKEYQLNNSSIGNSENGKNSFVFVDLYSKLALIPCFDLPFFTFFLCFFYLALDTLPFLAFVDQPEEWNDLTFTTYLIDGSTRVSLIPGGETIPVTLLNYREYLSLLINFKLQESIVMFKAFREGLMNVLPVELFPIFTSHELESLICGSSQIDMNLIKKFTEYEGFEGNSSFIGEFWEVLNEMTDEEKTLFLRYTTLCAFLSYCFSNFVLCLFS